MTIRKVVLGIIQTDYKSIGLFLARLIFGGLIFGRIFKMWGGGLIYLFEGGIIVVSLIRSSYAI